MTTTNTREALIHTICPHIKQWSDTEDAPCAKCPATVQTSQGEGVQMCRLNAERAADDVLALAAPQGADTRANYEDRHRSDMVLHPLSEIREWDEALQVLGIQDSDQTPADAIRELLARGADTREAVIEECAGVAEENKLYWAKQVDPCKPDDPSRRILSAKSAACFQIEMDIRALSRSSTGSDSTDRGTP